MDKVYLLKENIKPLDVAYKYLGNPIKVKNDRYWYKSPFRNETAPSFVVSNDKGFHDFGDSTHYDIFSFIAKYYNTTFKEAINILANDFNIDIKDKYNFGTSVLLLKKQKEQERKVKEIIENWYMDTFNKLSNIYIEYRELKQILSIDFPRIKDIYRKEQYYEYLVDMFLNANTEEKKFDLYNQKEVIKCMVE